MGINAVSSVASVVVVAPVAVAAKPVAVQETISASANSQTVARARNDSAAVVVNNEDVTQDSNSNNNRQPSESELAKVTEDLNTFMESMNADVKFTLHTRTNQLMVQVEDSKTHKILKECPAHELLDVVARMRDCVGVLLDRKA